MLDSMEKLKGTIPDTVINQLPAVISQFGISTPLRLAHFLAQCHHESGGFKHTKENLNYSAQGLKKTFGKYFTEGLLITYAHKPEKIANRVYAGRFGNGNEASGDGFKFCGHGYIQLTFRANYERFSQFIGVDVVAQPELVATQYPLASAAFFFADHKLWTICDKGATDTIVTELTKRINGGYNGLAERITLFKRYYALLK